MGFCGLRHRLPEPQRPRWAAGNHAESSWDPPWDRGRLARPW